jgi:hypothetical protein
VKNVTVKRTTEDESTVNSILYKIEPIRKYIPTFNIGHSCPVLSPYNRSSISANAGTGNL